MSSCGRATLMRVTEYPEILTHSTSVYPAWLGAALKLTNKCRYFKINLMSLAVFFFFAFTTFHSVELPLKYSRITKYLRKLEGKPFKMWGFFLFFFFLFFLPIRPYSVQRGHSPSQSWTAAALFKNPTVIEWWDWGGCFFFVISFPVVTMPLVQ